MNSLYERTFKNPPLLEEMLALRLQGWSITALADRYHCNHTSIWHQCRKHNIVPIRLTVRLIQPKNTPTYTDFDGEVINRGKTYREYRREAEERRRKLFSEQLVLRKIQMRAVNTAL